MCWSAAIGLLALAFLVVLGPLVFRAALTYAPWLDPLESHYNVGRLGIATVLLTTSLLILHMWLPAGRRPFGAVWPASSRRWCCGLCRLRIRPLFVRFFLRLRDLLRRPRFGDDRAGVSLFHRADLHLRRRTQRRDRACAQKSAMESRNRSGSDRPRPTEAQTQPKSRLRRNKRSARQPRVDCRFSSGTDAASSASSKLRRPVRGALTSTAMLPGLCRLVRINSWA